MTAYTHGLTAANIDSLSEAVKNLHSAPIQLRFPKQLDSLLCKILSFMT